MVDCAKLLAELVDKKLAQHYELDDSNKKKVVFISLLLNPPFQLLFIYVSFSFNCL